MIDQHTHTHYSPDANQETTFIDYVNQARSLGFSGVMVTEHVDYDSPDPLFQKIIDYDQYFNDIEYARKITGFDVRVGVELGYQKVSVPKMKKLVSSFPFDFVILSVHLIDGEDPYYGAYFKGKTQEESIRRYFEEVLESVKTVDDYDVFGHLDHIIRYGEFAQRTYAYDHYKSLLDSILTTIIEKGKGIEINMSGMDDITGFSYPSLEVLKRYKDLGGKIITIGSDAHRYQDLGRYFKKAKEILLEAGFDEVAIYQKRQPIFVKLNEVIR